MRRNVILLLAVGSLLVYGCGKDRTQQKQSAKRSGCFQILSNRDDHRPIIIVKVVDENGSIFPQAFVTVTSASDTFSGFTDGAGIFDADIKTLGAYHISISASGYVPINDSATAVDSITNVTETLHFS
jgi:hypothetical protein